MAHVRDGRLPVYEFPERELCLYRNHGIAHADTREMVPHPLTGCYFDLEHILRIDEECDGRPEHYWRKFHSDAPEIVITSTRFRSMIPQKRARTFDPNKMLEDLKLEIHHSGMRRGYSGASLIPIYADEA